MRFFIFLNMKHFLISVFVLWTLASSAQKITIDLPHFADKEYVWVVFVGEKLDTVARGTLDMNGQTVLTVPPAYKNWQGMSNCLLASGGGLQLILNGEKDFTGGCAVAAPTVNDIYYTGSEENSFLLEQYKRQQGLLSKASAIAAAMQAYTPEEPFYKAVSKEKKALEKRYAKLQRQTAESPLFAARIRQISDFCSGIGSRLDLTEKEMIEEGRQYAREVVDFSQLWNSGMWKPFFSQWINLEMSQKNDSLLVADSHAILAREQDDNMRMILVKKMLLLFTQYGKENLLSQLGMEDLLSPGNQAPKLYLPDSTRIVPTNSLVIFYESGCGNCENELVQLRGNYPVLQARNIRVISVSADTDEDVYKKNADTFPWEQKLCDFKGFDGMNFRNYAVIGTPTIYVIDGKGTITGRYSRLADYLNK